MPPRSSAGQLRRFSGGASANTDRRLKWTVVTSAIAGLRPKLGRPSIIFGGLPQRYFVEGTSMQLTSGHKNVQLSSGHKVERLYGPTSKVRPDGVHLRARYVTYDRTPVSAGPSVPGGHASAKSVWQLITSYRMMTTERDHVDRLLRLVRTSGRFNQRTYRVSKYLSSRDAKLLATIEADAAMRRNLGVAGYNEAEREAIASKLDPVEGNRQACAILEEEILRERPQVYLRFRNRKPRPSVPGPRRAECTA